MVAAGLSDKNLFAGFRVVALVKISGFGDDAQILLDAYHDVAQGFFCVLSEGTPWFLDETGLAGAEIFPQAIMFFFAAGAVVQVVDYRARCAGNDDGIHGMVPMVNAFSAEAGL